ncbi:hypothetical protein CCHL11_03401 [Colletotrichum chlorophyti]|uniref:Uncharacterized protein n=1 Tax=Colletotrichum chlorophyti TaxID=708187 RepID=A0A1Q8S055_9PEZI|nr:hypothetical protein CCHL11_03401 [Colletotrichum chlorophyti]
MSSSLARTRSLRKPAQGSSTDLPPASASSSTSVPASASSTSARDNRNPTPSQRPSSPSRLPGPRLAAPRPTARSVSNSSVTSTSDATKKKSNPISALLSRTSTRKPAASTTTTRQRDDAEPARRRLEHDHKTGDFRRPALDETPDDNSHDGTRERPCPRKERGDPQQQHRPPAPESVVLRPRPGPLPTDITLRRTAVVLVSDDIIIIETTPALLTSPTSPPRNTTAAAAKPALRPAFSTLQQHYSPAKSLAPKPLTATYLAPPSPSKLPTNVALSAETSRLQTELLQLHLLHRELPSTTSQYHASARNALAARHASLAKSSQDLASLERDAAERQNTSALHRWSSSPASLPLDEKVQRLDGLLSTLWSLDSPGGKHARLVRAFERWSSSLPDLEAARVRAESSSDPSALLDANLDVRFVGGLDARWKDEASALTRRLEAWDAQLRGELAYQGDSVDDGGDGASSLNRILDGCRSLVRDMLDELSVMEEIEAAAVERETEWIRRVNREGDDGRGRDTPRAGAIWRVL